MYTPEALIFPSAAYMERQRMAVRCGINTHARCTDPFRKFHSDSERGLGPIIAGLSLGSPALMHFRVHHRYLREEEIDNKAIALTIILRHVSQTSDHRNYPVITVQGDILVMDGAGIQVRYE